MDIAANLLKEAFQQADRAPHFVSRFGHEDRVVTRVAVTNQEHVFVTAFRGELDLNLLGPLFEAAEPVESLKIIECPSTIGSFSLVAVVPPTLVDFFRRNAELSSITFQVIPMHWGEFWGDEDRNLYQEIARRIVPILDWKRAPCPHVRSAFWEYGKGPERGFGTIPKAGLVVQPVDQCLQILQSLPSDNRSWLRVKNAAGDDVVFKRSRSGGLCLASVRDELRDDVLQPLKQDARCFIESFASRGSEHGPTSRIASDRKKPPLSRSDEVAKTRERDEESDQKKPRQSRSDAVARTRKGDKGKKSS